MAFGNSADRRSTKKGEFVHAVGWRAYINWAALAGPGERQVPMVDGAGAQIGNDLVDGQEVEILSWRPRSREGLAYQVRRISDGTEWWIASTYLRRTPIAAPVVAEGAVPAAAAKLEQR